MSLTYKDVAEILKLIDASDCDELELDLDGARLVVRRNTAGSATAAYTPASGEEATVTLTANAADAAIAGACPPAEQPGVSDQPGLMEVRAPMVGTFYRRPLPEDPPFVEEGGKVKRGDPLGLIEVMKLFTKIEAPVDGTVSFVIVGDRGTVEFNQLICRIQA